MISSPGAAKSDMMPAWPTARIVSAPYNAVRFTLFSMKAPAPGAIWRWNWEWTFLTLDEDLLKRLEMAGLRRGLIERTNFPKLAADVPTLDFSGWPIYTHQEHRRYPGHGFLPGAGDEQRSHSLGGRRSATSRANGSRYFRRPSRSAVASCSRTVLARMRLYIRISFAQPSPKKLASVYPAKSGFQLRPATDTGR